MPKGRKFCLLYAEVAEDAKANELVEKSALAEVARLWSLARCDVYGTLDGSPRLFRATVFPALDITLRRIATIIDLLVEMGFYHRYEVDGEVYLWVRKYHEYQRVKWSRVGPPRRPLPDCWTGKDGNEVLTLEQLHERYRTNPGLIPDQSRSGLPSQDRHDRHDRQDRQEGERAPAGAPPSPLSDFEHGTGAEQTPQRLVPGLSAQQVEERNFVSANPLTPQHVRAVLSTIWGPDWHRTTTERKPGVDWPGELCLLWTDPEAPVNREDCLALLKRYKPRRTEHPSEWWARVGPRPPDGPRDPIDVHRERAAWDWNHPWELPTPAPIQRQCSRWEELIFRLTIARDPRLREVMDAYHAAHIAYRDTKDAEAFPMPPFPPEEVNVE